MGVVALAGCKQQISPRQQASDDAVAIAKAEAAQDSRPPIKAVSPEPLNALDMQKYGLGGVGCGLIPGAPPAGDAVVFAAPKRATLKLEGRLVSLASDPGSTPLPLGAWTHYVGKELSLKLEKTDGDGSNAGSDRMRWNGRMTVRDAWDRIVYTTVGALECGS